MRSAWSERVMLSAGSQASLTAIAGSWAITAHNLNRTTTMKTYSLLIAFFAIESAMFINLPDQVMAQTSSRYNSVNESVMHGSDTSAVRLINAFLTAVQQGDHTIPKAVLHPNVKWHQPGSNRFAGTKESSAAVFQMVRSMSEASSRTLRLADVKLITVNGNQVACLVNWKAVMEGGGVLDVDNIDVYTLENGKIVEATVYSADLAQEDWFWGK